MYEQEIAIPTYLLGEPNPDPIFYTPIQYQCAQLHVYPYVFLDNLTDVKIDKKYKGLFLENEYVKICVLPEIGGRVYIGEDKTNNYNYLYRNNVIKPALIGPAGAWMSGGIEWNIPHHHRASTFMPVDYDLVENADGSKTIFVGEYEKRHQTRWVVSLTLYPGKSYVETTIRYMNVTPVENSFLFFSNAAVHANDNYQVFFAPDVELAANHTKNEYSTWPIAKNTYRGFDYKNGADVSFWKNSSVPVSFFAYGSNMDFFGGIDHGKNAGTVFVGDHHIFPGQKMWNWGKTEIARSWDKNLTDNDGAYLELMMGMYSDNQPDYSWNNPLSTKWGTMCFYPIKNMQAIKNANSNFSVNLENQNNKVLVEVNATSIFNDVKVLLTNKGKEIISEVAQISPNKPWQKQINVPAGTLDTDLKLSVAKDAKELISYQPVVKKNPPMPETYKEPEEPSKITSVEDLYLAGLRLEQFSNPYYNPMAYYEEALKREPQNAQVNTQVGIWYLKRGMYKKAEEYLSTAQKRVTLNIMRARNGEPLYYLGIALFNQGRYDEAYDMLYDATWCEAFVSPAYYYLAVIDCRRGDLNKAFEKINRSVAANSFNIEALVLKATLLRKLGNPDEALHVVQSISQFDPLNFTGLFENYLSLKAQNNAASAEKALSKLQDKLRNEPDNYFETSWRYAAIGCYDEAAGLLEMAAKSADAKLNSNPLVYYYLGYNYHNLGKKDLATARFGEAAVKPLQFCFPYGHASMAVLQSAIDNNANDANAHYLMGMLLCDQQPSESLAEWQMAVKINPSIAMAYRNMAFVQANIFDKIDDAIANLQKAISLDKNDPQYFFEIDKYLTYKKATPEQRFDQLKDCFATIYKSTSALMQYIIVENLLGKYDDVLKVMESYHFRVPEMTNINPHEQYTDAHLYKGVELMLAKQYDQAKAHFEKILEFPKNLESGGNTKSEIAHFWLGKTYKAIGKKDLAKTEFEAYLHESSRDREPVMLYYKGMAYKELNQKDKAIEIFNEMIKKAENGNEKKTHEVFDNSSVSKRMEKKIAKSQSAFMLALANLGLGNEDKCHEVLTDAVLHDPSNLDARMFLNGKEFVGLLK
jgi:tetratricopeptide (TPR) repeat protein